MLWFMLDVLHLPIQISMFLLALCPVRLACMRKYRWAPCSVVSSWVWSREGITRREKGALRVSVPFRPTPTPCRQNACLYCEGHSLSQAALTVWLSPSLVIAPHFTFSALKVVMGLSHVFLFYLNPADHFIRTLTFLVPVGICHPFSWQVTTGYSLMYYIYLHLKRETGGRCEEDTLRNKTGRNLHCLLLKNYLVICIDLNELFEGFWPMRVEKGIELCKLPPYSRYRTALLSP